MLYIQLSLEPYTIWAGVQTRTLIPIRIQTKLNNYTLCVVMDMRNNELLFERMYDSYSSTDCTLTMYLSINCFPNINRYK